MITPEAGVIRMPSLLPSLVVGVPMYSKRPVSVPLLPLFWSAA
ncbi:MAG: hypothetical protein WDO13_15705 [Verrucomicrobiota bacterium]